MKHSFSRLCVVLLLLVCFFFLPQTTLLSHSASYDAADESSVSQSIENGFLPEPYEDLQLYAQSAVLIDGDTNRILYAKNPDVHMPNASTTKILTCILAIELGDLGQVCSVSDYARSMPETKCGFYQGDSFYLKDLLYSLMLESHNDSAVVIAEAIGGSVEGFATLMNEKAKEIGCHNSYFITPNGLDGEDSHGIHGSSAYDLALIMNYCRQNETFIEITRTQNYKFSDVEGQHQYSVRNLNSFLSMQSGALTGKTGYTSKAGYCYVCAYQEEGRNYSLALLACGWPNHKTYKWQDAKALIQYGNNYYKKTKIGNPVENYKIFIPEGISMFNNSFSYCEETAIQTDGKQWEQLLGENDEITTTLELEKVVLPIKKDEEAGVLKYYINNDFAGEQKLYYTETIIEQDFSWCFTHLMKEFLQKASF